MTRDELLELLARLRYAPVGRARLRAPHKPLLLMWLFGRFAATGSSAAAAYGRIPARSHDGDQLRRTARMIALAGNLTGDNTLMAIALVAQLVALAAAVAELRQAQQHAAQAAAARAAAAHLHAAVTQARSRAPRFGQGQSQRPARGADPTRNTRLDFPAGARPTQQPGHQAASPRPPSPQQGRIPPRRTGRGP
jgi:hypothetical protein